jgi:hypothetical protein
MFGFIPARADFTYPNAVTGNQLRALKRAAPMSPGIAKAQITNIESLSQTAGHGRAGKTAQSEAQDHSHRL